MGKLNNFILEMKQKPFIKSLINDLKSDVYVVGGVVRDLILNKQNKDIDLVVGKVDIDTLIGNLQKFGRVDVVGKSFGVIKFIDSDGVDYDIALPRQDMKNDKGGYRGFDVQSDKNLPIEDELIRRDAKMNAMAININTGKFIDPLGGLDDIEKKQISAANPEAFSDDPLRMIRIVGFASRFGFTIEPQTMRMIQENAERVKEIAPERILTEFDKIIKKGNILMGVELLISTGLFAQIFGQNLKPSMIGRRDFSSVKTMGEFIFLLSNGVVESPAEFYKNNLKGNIDTYKEIKALELAFTQPDITHPVMERSIAHNMYLLSPQALQSQIIPMGLQKASEELLSGKYPKTVGELAVNGNDLIKLGLVGKEIGIAQKTLLLNVYSDSVRNNREDLLNLDTRNKGPQISADLNKGDEVIEGVADKYAEKAFNIPDPNTVGDVKAMADAQTGLETPYGYVTGKDGKGERFKIPAFKNPKSLTNFGANVRAIGDGMGDLFVVQENGWFNHGDMGFRLRLANSDMDIYSEEDFVLLHRIGKTNDFGLSDSTADYAERNYDNNENIKSILDAIKQKNPQYDFYAEYYQNIESSTSLDELYFPELHKQKNTWMVNDEMVDINFFTDQYYQWNQGRYDDTTDKSVREFIDNIYPDFNDDVKLKHDLYHKLVDNEVLDEEAIKGSLNEMSINSISFENIVTPEYINNLKRSDNYESYLEYFKYEYRLEDQENEELEKHPAFERWLNNELYGKYEYAIESIQNKIKADNTIDIWRVMTVEKDWIKQLPITGKHLGLYWSWEERAADAHWGYSGNIKILIKSSVSEEYVDWYNTVVANMDINLGEDEKEITLFKNTILKIEELYVDDVNIIDTPKGNQLKNKTFLAEEMKRNVRYTAVVLDDKSRSALLARLGNMIPNGWETIAHHMTINMGEIDPKFEKYLGMTVDLTAVDFAMDEKVMAVGVTGFETKNQKPHITLAVNRTAGGKPMMSNQLTDWQKLSEPLILTGKVTEV